MPHRREVLAAAAAASTLGLAGCASEPRPSPRYHTVIEPGSKSEESIFDSVTVLVTENVFGPVIYGARFKFGPHDTQFLLRVTEDGEGLTSSNSTYTVDAGARSGEVEFNTGLDRLPIEIRAKARGETLGVATIYETDGAITKWGNS